MAVVSRTGMAVLIALLGCLLSSCSRTPETMEQRTAPSREELAAEIASLAEVSSNFDQVRSILVAKDGELVHEKYYDADADAYWHVASVTKSVVSTLIGIAIGDGLIGGVDDTLAQLLPEDVDVMSPAVRATTLRQVLTMDAGFPPGREGMSDATGLGITESTNWVREILANPEGPPGQGFEYSNRTSHLLAAIVGQAAGISPLDYARKRLFGPLGIDSTPAWTEVVGRGGIEAYESSGFAWPKDPQGINTGWALLKLRSRDMVKLGQLFLDGGRWEGQQIVPQEWVEEATAQQIDAGDLGYGYQWWTGDVDGAMSFQAWGAGGQVIVVVPSRDLVVATTTELRLTDASSHGIDDGVLYAIIEDGVVSQFPPTS